MTKINTKENYVYKESEEILGRSTIVTEDSRYDYNDEQYDDFVNFAPRSAYKEEWYEVITGEEMLKYELTEIPKLIDPIFPKVGIAALAGSSDTGKSAFLRQLAIAVVAGDREFLGYPLKAEHKSAIYVSTEDDRDATTALFKKQVLGRYEGESFGGLRFLFGASKIIPRLETELTKQKADVIIIDAFGDILEGKDANNVSHIRPLLSHYKDLARKHECLIIFLHHTGKRTDHLPPSKESLVGSQGFEASMRTVAILKRDQNDPHKRHFCVVKGNYIPEDTALKRESVELYFDNNLRFTPTGNHCSFEFLGAKNVAEGKKSWQQRAVEIYTEGVSKRKVAEILAKEGYLNASKSTVADFLKRTEGMEIAKENVPLDFGIVYSGKRAEA